MHDGVYRRLAATEDDHWWFRSRRLLVLRTLRRLGIGPVESALDAGCGTGGNLGMLGSVARQVAGLDRSPLALRLAAEKRPGARLVEGDVLRLGASLPGESFDLVTLFNVLYHSWVPDKAAALREVRAVLRPGGHLVLTEPAFPILFRRHDLVVMGSVRFRLPGIRRLLAEAGLEPVAGTYFNALSFPPALALSLLSRLAGERTELREPGVDAAEMGLPPRWVDGLLGGAMSIERGWIGAGLPVPFGVTLLCVARRPGGDQRSGGGDPASPGPGGGIAPSVESRTK